MDTRPVISLSSPAAGSSYHIWDTILVKASISHNKPVRSVVVSLVNNNNIPMVTPIGSTPDQNTLEIEEYLVVDNPNLESGNYFVMVKASDEVNATRYFQPVEVSGIETELRRILVITQFNTLKSIVSLIDSNFNVSPLFSILKKYNGSDVSSRYQQLYYITPEPSRLLTYNLNDTILDWEFLSQPPHSGFQDVYYQEGLIYLASQNGNLFGLDHSGDNKYITPTHTDRIPQKIFKHENYLVTDQSTRSNLYRYFTLFFAETGAFANQHQRDLGVIEFFSINQDEIIAFGNMLDQAKVLVYSIENNNSFEPAIMPTGIITAAVQISQEDFLIAMDFGIIAYNSTQHQWHLAFDIDNVIAMEYDSKNNFLCVAEGKNVRIYDYPGSSLLHGISMDYPILNIHILYNK